MMYEDKVNANLNYEGLENILMTSDDKLSKVDKFMYVFVPPVEASPIKINAHSRSLQI